MINRHVVVLHKRGMCTLLLLLIKGDDRHLLMLCTVASPL
uniref:Uncharacterized protein n=1 Tax=Globodera pallida TaxID=36090 RepID=A0A183CRH1_GLOPA